VRSSGLGRAASGPEHKPPKSSDGFFQNVQRLHDTIPPHSVSEVSAEVIGL
jgi:hypothetical protein